MLNYRYYNHIFSQFKVTVIFHHIIATHSRSDISNMKVISFCTATLVRVDNSTHYCLFWTPRAVIENLCIFVENKILM